MYAVSEIFLPRERFESISRMDSHDTELEYLTTGGGRVNGGSGNGETLLLERISLHPPLLSISLIVSNLSRNGGDTYGWRKKRAKRISCAHFLHHFSNASCFFRQAVSSIHSLLNRLSTRFSRSVAGPKRHSVIYFRYSNLKTAGFSLYLLGYTKMITFLFERTFWILIWEAERSIFNILLSQIRHAIDSIVYDENN